MNDLSLTGIELIGDSSLTRPEMVTRTWREQLFSRPWRPLRSWKIIQVPDEKIYQLTLMAGKTVIVAHPATIEKIKEARKPCAKSK